MKVSEKLRVGQRVGMIVSMTALAVGTTGCGKSGFNLVTNVQVNSYLQEGDAYGEVQARLNTGNTRLPAFNFVIRHPDHPEREYGAIGMQDILTGGSQLNIGVNVTQIARLRGVTDRLPNGTMIPVGGLGQTQVIGIPTGSDTDPWIYVAFGPGVALVGTAIPIREFNGIGRSIGGMNLFPSFDFGGGVRGVAGIFTGNQAGQSGLAFFVDLGGALAKVQLGSSEQNTEGALTQTVSSALRATGATSYDSVNARETEEQLEQFQAAYKKRGSALRIRSIAPSRSKERRLNNSLYQMHRKRVRMNLH